MKISGFEFSYVDHFRGYDRYTAQYSGFHLNLQTKWVKKDHQFELAIAAYEPTPAEEALCLLLDIDPEGDEATAFLPHVSAMPPISWHAGDDEDLVFDQVDEIIEKAREAFKARIKVARTAMIKAALAE